MIQEIIQHNKVKHCKPIIKLLVILKIICSVPVTTKNTNDYIYIGWMTVQWVIFLVIKIHTQSTDRTCVMYVTSRSKKSTIWPITSGYTRVRDHICVTYVISLSHVTVVWQSTSWLTRMCDHIYVTYVTNHSNKIASW